jgi:hypothetical protein
MQDPPRNATPVAQYAALLMRASELLQADQVHDAKQEIEKALRLQPRESRGQALLAMIYYRLGMFPRAVSTYEELIASHPEEIGPRVNLSLCFLKTGQPERARVMLEDVVRAHPGHERAWGYLALAFERLGEPERARVCQERAGQKGGGGDSTTPEPGPEQLQLDGAEGRSRMSTLAAPLTRDKTIALDGGPGVRLVDGVVVVGIEEGFAARLDLVRAVKAAPGGVVTTPLMRRARGKEESDALGAQDKPMHLVTGATHLVMQPRNGRRLSVVRLDGDFVYVREAVLAGFDQALSYENGKLAIGEGQIATMVRVHGRGHVVLDLPNSFNAVEVTSSSTLLVRRTAVLGWSGRLVPHAPGPGEAPSGLRDCVVFSGDGGVWIEPQD